MNVAEILEAAADWLECNGWVQGKYYQGMSSCSVGAILRVAKVSSMLLNDDECPTEISEAISAMQKVAGGPLLHWNDQPERTAEEVVAAFRAAAAVERMKSCEQQKESPQPITVTA